MKSLLIKINIVRKWLRSLIESESLIVDQFHKKYYNIGEQTTFNTFWDGVHTLKCPLDLWIYQEIIWEKAPDVIIECGTKYGGSALYLAQVCDRRQKGRVITVDILEQPDRPQHNRITYINGSSVAEDVVHQVKGLIKSGESVMVILDSLHRCDHVYRELENYAPLVTSGQYLIVEDTNINGHPARPSFGPGPMEAVVLFMKNREKEFACDRTREKFLLTYNPKGYWQKK